MEEWKVIEGWDAYEISNRGVVRRAGRVLRWRACGRRNEKYPRVALHQEGIRKDVPIHHLVALHFIGPRPEGLQINHKDRNRFNPSVENLEYVTPAYNTQHSYDNGRKGLLGQRNPAAKLTQEQVAEIKELYQPRTIGGMGQVALAKKYGVTQTAIWAVLNGKCWKGVQ